MDPTSVIDDTGFWLPDEFLTDDDFLPEKKNKLLNDGDATVEEENFLSGLSRKMVKSTLEDEFSRGFCSNQAFPAWNTNRSSLCAAGYDCVCGNPRLNQSRQSQVSSQAAAWDLYCAAAEEMAMMNINEDLNSYSGKGLLDLPINSGSGYYNLRSLQYHKLQAIKFQQLKQQQLMKFRRDLVQQSRGKMVNNSNKIGPSNHQLRRDGSGMRAVFIGEKRSSTGTGVFLPRGVNRMSPVTSETRKTPSAISTVLVPARVAQVLNLNQDEPVVQPVVRSSPSLKDVSWRQSNNNGGFSKMEQAVKEPRLPTDWAY